MGKRRLKPKWRVIIPTLIVLILVIVMLVYLVTFLIGLIKGAGDKRNKLYCPKNSIKLVNKVVGKTYNKTETIGDSFFYGDSWVVVSQVYDSIGKFNNYQGKSLKAVNICNNKEYNFNLGFEFDNYLPLSKLEPGVYEVFLVNNTIESRLKMDPQLAMSLYTPSSNGNANLVEIFSTKDYFKEISETNLLKDDYVFIRVSPQKLPQDTYDIVIDVGFNELNDTTDSNEIFRDNKEAKQLFDLAEEVASELRKQGYKVLVTRESFDDEMVTYGLDGRIHRALTAQGKLYISLTLGKNTDATKRGAQIVHSFYASDKLSNAIYQRLTKEKITFNQNPIRPSTRVKDYDSEIDIREVGGIALQAATYSDRTKNENGSFGYTPNGLNGIRIILGQSPNDSDMTDFANEYKNWAKAIAQGINDYLKR